MRHRRARRLIFALPDGLLSARAELQVRQHAQGCARCRRSLLGLEAAEALLRRLPATLTPLEPSREAEARLAGLARWSPDRGACPGRTTSARDGLPTRWALPTFAAVSAAACLAAVLLTSGPAVVSGDGPDEQEAFNFVLASDLWSTSRPRGSGRPARAGATALAVAEASGATDHYYLPIAAP